MAAFSAAIFKESVLSETAKVSRLSVIEIDILFRQLQEEAGRVPTEWLMFNLTSLLSSLPTMLQSSALRTIQVD